MNRCHTAAILSLTMLMVPVIASAGTVDELVEKYRQRSGTPGLSLVVIKDGKIVHEGAYGLASIELNVPVSRDTVYQIASTTKIFTGVAIMMLVEQGRIALSDRVSSIVPGLPEAWSEVTVRQILTHTSGLPDALDDHGQAVADTPEHLFGTLSGRALDFPPGDGWSYNQTGFVLAGEIIRIRTGLSFDEFCREHIFQPLGMTATSFGGARHLVPGRASYYTADDQGSLIPHLDGIYPELTWTGAGLNTSAGDLARFDIALHRGQLLKPETAETMFSPARLNDGTVFRHRTGTTGYGLGWACIDYPDHPAVGMQGGYTNAYYRFTSDDLAIIVLTNLVGREPPTSLIEDLAGHYISGFRSPLEQRREYRNLLARDSSRARVLGRQLVDGAKSNAALLNSLAWIMATEAPPADRDLETALRAAERAADLTRHEDAGVLDTLARVHYEMGHADLAIRWQQKAVEQAEDERLRKELSSTLSRYRRATGAGN